MAGTPPYDSPAPSNAGIHEDLGWLLDGFPDRVPGFVGAVLATTDGMHKAAAGLDRDSAERIGAITSSFFSLARGLGRALG
jgi:predicted regulator of Ras-like GTPase activity (Roadblock/LC7/MglB family)